MALSIKKTSTGRIWDILLSAYKNFPEFSTFLWLTLGNAKNIMIILSGNYSGLNTIHIVAQYFEDFTFLENF